MEALNTMPDYVVQFLGVCAALITAAGAYKAVIAPAVRGLRQVGRFLDDWYGEPENGRPGVLGQLRDLDERVKRVHNQTHANGGLSLRDAVGRIESKLDDHMHEATHRDRRHDSAERRLDRLEERNRS